MIVEHALVGVRDRRRGACAGRARRAMAVAVLVLVAVMPSPPAGADPSEDEDLVSGGAFSCDFEVSLDAPLDRIAPLIERDRIYMARRPGMLNKHLPIRPAPDTEPLQAGGRYLFDTYDHAKAYEQFVTHDFVLDGTQFLDRTAFVNPDCRAWSTIGAHDFADIHTSRVVMRTERWSAPGANLRPLLQSRWPAVRAEAARRGLTSVWLLYDKPTNTVAVVVYDDRVAPVVPGELDVPSLVALETAPSMGAVLVDPTWAKTMDITHWVLTIWFPNTPSGDGGEPSLWPNSPPLPEPGPNDGVCEPSRGENNTTAPNDCTPRCGDGVEQAGEDNARCPSDVPAA